MQPCRLRMCPQTAQEGGGGEKEAGRQAGEGGGLSLENMARPQTSSPLAQELCQNTHDMCVQYAGTNGRQI